ncbi:hypothetical protein BLNAU_3544 [Blattamonas nauphoetae]|uniref:Uncharacterized protein n=1 Tax=Blattamonas nauphoetae TaxID=2049346 RepID=A0ABQ9YCD2_9EUKA|nr:hypothetical protein BLNAU_3544 [Blattamonas nauphoetae]
MPLFTNLAPLLETKDHTLRTTVLSLLCLFTPLPPLTHTATKSSEEEEPENKIPEGLSLEEKKRALKKQKKKEKKLLKKKRDLDTADPDPAETSNSFKKTLSDLKLDDFQSLQDEKLIDQSTIVEDSDTTQRTLEWSNRKKPVIEESAEMLKHDDNVQSTICVDQSVWMPFSVSEADLTPLGHLLPIHTIETGIDNSYDASHRLAIPLSSITTCPITLLDEYPSLSSFLHIHSTLILFSLLHPSVPLHQPIKSKAADSPLGDLPVTFRSQTDDLDSIGLHSLPDSNLRGRRQTLRKPSSLSNSVASVTPPPGIGKNQPFTLVDTTDHEPRTKHLLFSASLPPLLNVNQPETEVTFDYAPTIVLNTTQLNDGRFASFSPFTASLLTKDPPPFDSLFRPKRFKSLGIRPNTTSFIVPPASTALVSLIMPLLFRQLIPDTKTPPSQHILGVLQRLFQVLRPLLTIVEETNAFSNPVAVVDVSNPDNSTVPAVKFTQAQKLSLRHHSIGDSEDHSGSSATLNSDQRPPADEKANMGQALTLLSKQPKV